MAKKNFENITTRTSRTNAEVQELATSTGRTQTTASAEERAERMKNGNTRGRKGCKMHSINIRFTDENWEFVQVYSKATGRSFSGAVDDIITNYRKQNAEIENLIKENLERIRELDNL